MKIQIHEYDGTRVYTGTTREIGLGDGCPTGWTREPLPALEPGQVALFQGNSWCVLQARPTVSYDRAYAASQIDDAVAAIYSRFTRFESEYVERESQAKAYQDAGYTGSVPKRVADFCVPAGLAPSAAADLILSQAASLRTAQDQLSALRMCKYEVLRASTDNDAERLAAQLLAQIEIVGGQVS